MNENTIETWAWDFIDDNDPEVINIIQRKLQMGLSPEDIAAEFATHNIFLAAMVEMAATIMLEDKS